MVPAPTAWTDAAAPPPRTRKTISIAVVELIAVRTLKTTDRLKETI
jgi:hypothetical protein